MLKTGKTIFFLLNALFGCFVGLSQEWQTDFETAKQMAQDGNRPIILVFQGSDWCAPCIKLDREVWSTTVFTSYAQEHYVMLQADFPRKKQNALSPEQTSANKLLAEKYNRKGIFPLVVLLDAKGNQLGSTGYKRMLPKTYIQELNKFLE